mgnify:FL=1
MNEFKETLSKAEIKRLASFFGLNAESEDENYVYFDFVFRIQEGVTLERAIKMLARETQISAKEKGKAETETEIRESLSALKRFF